MLPGRDPDGPTRRARACRSNASTLDKCLGVWEAQQEALPTDRDLWLEIRTDGSISNVSPDLSAWQSGRPRKLRDQLVPGSKVLFDYSKDLNTVICVARYHQVGFPALEKAPEVHFRWVSGKTPLPELGGKTRGAYCLPFRTVGESGKPDDRHGP